MAALSCSESLEELMAVRHGPLPSSRAPDRFGRRQLRSCADPVRDQPTSVLAGRGPIGPYNYARAPRCSRCVYSDNTAPPPRPSGCASTAPWCR